MIAPQPAPSGFIFISYAREDSAFVERFTGDLREAGVSIWIDTEGLKPGTRNWEKSLREAIGHAVAVLLIASPDSRRSDYVQDELAIAEMCGRPIFPVWAQGEHWIDCIPMGMGKMQFVDVRGDYYHHGMRNVITALDAAKQIGGGGRNRTTPPPFTLAEVLGSAPMVETIRSTHAPPLRPDPAQWAAEAEFEPRNPYKGLRAFREDDQDDFFGRDRFLDELLEALMMPGERILPVVGPSGSGKSSVVMAGLMPRLHNGALPESDTWYYLPTITPTDHPLERLAVTLKTALPQSGIATIQNDLSHAGARGLHLLTSQIASEQGCSRVALYIDQFEEVFTQLDADNPEQENERRQFINLLTTAVGEPKGVLVVILTMRADFYDRPMNYPDLGRIMEKRGKSVYALSLAELYEVIQRPAALPDVQLAFDDGLLVQLVFDVRDQAGGLPLLQFALDQLFKLREGQRLTMAAYQAIGGVRGALTTHAESTYTNLGSDNQRAMARSLFLRLIEPGATELDTTRRRARLEELEQADPAHQTDMQHVVDTFVNSRLLMTDHGASGTTIEVSHEALIREWKRLSGWLEEARDDINLQQEISADVREWTNRDRPSDRLYRGAQLADALEWSRRARPSVSEVEFLGESEQSEARFHRRQRIRNMAMLALAILIPIIIAIALFIFNQQQAESLDTIRTTQAEAFPLLADSLLTGSNPDVPRALDVAMKGLSYGDAYYRPEGHAALINVLGARFAEQPSAFADTMPVTSMIWNREGTYFLTTRQPASTTPCPGDRCIFRIDIWDAEGRRLDIGLPDFSTNASVEWVPQGEEWNADQTYFIVRTVSPTRTDCSIVTCSFTTQMWGVDGKPMTDLIETDYQVDFAWSRDIDRVAIVPELVYSTSTTTPQITLWNPLTDEKTDALTLENILAPDTYHYGEYRWSEDGARFYYEYGGDSYVVSFEEGLVPLMNDGGFGTTYESPGNKRIVTVDMSSDCTEEPCASILTLWDGGGQVVAADLPHKDVVAAVRWIDEGKRFLVSSGNFVNFSECPPEGCITELQIFDQDGNPQGTKQVIKGEYETSFAADDMHFILNIYGEPDCTSDCRIEIFYWDIQADRMIRLLEHTGRSVVSTSREGNYFAVFISPADESRCRTRDCTYELWMWDLEGNPQGEPLQFNGAILNRGWNRTGDVMAFILQPSINCEGDACTFAVGIWDMNAEFVRYDLPARFDNRLDYRYATFTWNEASTHLVVRIVGSVEGLTIFSGVYIVDRQTGTLEQLGQPDDQASFTLGENYLLLLTSDGNCIRNCYQTRELWALDENGRYVKTMDNAQLTALWGNPELEEDPFFYTLDSDGILNVWRSADTDIRPYDPDEWEPTNRLAFQFSTLPGETKLMMIRDEPVYQIDLLETVGTTSIYGLAWNDEENPRYFMVSTERNVAVWDSASEGRILWRAVASNSYSSTWDTTGEHVILYSDDGEIERVVLDLGELRTLAEKHLVKLQELAAEATPEATEAGAVSS